MSSEEVGAPQGQLDDLDNILARRLRHSVRAQPTAVPLAGPPRPVRLVVLELTREEDGDENLVNRPLDVDCCSDTHDGVRHVPRFKEPLKTSLVPQARNK